MSTPTEAPPDGAVADDDAPAGESAAPEAPTIGAAAPDAVTRPDPPPIDRLAAGDRRRLRRAWALATMPVLVAYTWVITAGTWNLFQRQYFDDFFDVQARSLFDGRWDVPPDVVGFEGFLIHGKTYVYFGPFPAVLRMPVLLVTDRLDGRLTTVSMILAMAVLSFGTYRLACSLRQLVRGADPVGRREPLAMAGLAVAVMAGPPFFLASGAVVYHEATTWGLAFAALAFDAVVRFALRPTGWRLVGASTLVALTLFSRQSVGLAPLVSLALVCLWFLWRHARGGTGPWLRRIDLQAVVVLGSAGLAPLILVGAINYAKFESPFIPPSSAHVESMKYGPRQEMLEDNDGSLFGFQFAPTTLRQYTRLDGIDVRRDFPWIDFPRLGPSVVGNTNFDELDWSSSLPTAAAALTALSIVTAVWAIRHRRERRGGPPLIAALCIGAVCGAFGVMNLGYIANRYLNDLLPLVLIPGIVGFHVVVARAVGWSRMRRRLAVAGVGLLVVFTALVNSVLALSYQREKGPVIPEEWRAEWVGWRVGLPGAYSPYLADDVWRVMPRHKDVFDGRLAIVGDCAGMYLQRNNTWVGIERGPGVDVYDVVVDLDDLPEDGSRVPLMTMGAANSSIIGIVRVDEDTVRVDISRSRRQGYGWRQGTPVDLDGEVTIRIDADRREVPFTVTHGRTALNGASFDNDERRDQLGQAPGGKGVATRFPGRLRIDPPDMSACREALDLVRYNKAGFPIVE